MDNSTKICCALALIAIVLSLYSIFTREKYTAGSVYSDSDTGDGVITVDSSGNLSVNSLTQVQTNQGGISTNQDDIDALDVVVGGISTNSGSIGTNTTNISALTTKIANIESYLNSSGAPVQLYCAVSGWSGTPKTAQPSGVTNGIESTSVVSIEPSNNKVYIITDAQPLSSDDNEARVLIYSTNSTRPLGGYFAILWSVTVFNEGDNTDSSYSKIGHTVTVNQENNNIIWWRKHTGDGDLKPDKTCKCSLVLRFILNTSEWTTYADAFG